MSDKTPPQPENTQRSRAIGAALHIIEHSNADVLTKINFACSTLAPDDLKAVDACIKSCLQNLINKA